MASCLICTESFTSFPLSFSSEFDKIPLPCCKQSICQTCLHSHIHSIFIEGITGGGRKDLNCPMGCGVDLTDGQIRACIRRFHLTLRCAIWGQLRFKLLMVLSYFTGAESRDCNDSYRYKRWVTCTKSTGELRDLRLYEKWSLTVALSKRPSMTQGAGSISADLNSSTKRIKDKSNKKIGCANEHYVNVVRCPRTDCECIWLSNHSYYKRKLEHEKKYSDKSASSWLFYSPLKSTKEDSIVEVYGYTIAHWTESIQVKSNMKSEDALDVFNRQLYRDGGENDGRRVTCPKCSMTFCALCSRAWSTTPRIPSWFNNSPVRISHTNKLCSTYGRKAVSASEDDYIAIADAVDARACPGCTMRTSRVSGCNHMTCSCGFEWCFVCETRWNLSHYSCHDVTRISRESRTNCVIS